MAESRVTSIAAEVLATPDSEARVSSVTAEVLATAASEARVSAIAVEVLVSVAVGLAVLHRLVLDESYVPFFGASGAAGDDGMVARWSADPLGMIWPDRGRGIRDVGRWKG